MNSNEFLKEYDSNRVCCPKCKSRFYTTTLQGYVLDLNDMESYKDLNTCVCRDCGDKHTFHDRVKDLDEKTKKFLKEEDKEILDNMRRSFNENRKRNDNYN